MLRFTRRALENIAEISRVESTNHSHGMVETVICTSTC
jgi:hypothetical protein